MSDYIYLDSINGMILAKSEEEAKRHEAQGCIRRPPVSVPTDNPLAEVTPIRRRGVKNG